MLFGFMKSLPLEFEQAAEIDGASKLKTLTHIVVPLASSGIAATCDLGPFRTKGPFPGYG